MQLWYGDNRGLFIHAQLPIVQISVRERTDCELFYLSFISKHVPGSDYDKAQEHPQWIALCYSEFNQALALIRARIIYGASPPAEHGRPAESSPQSEHEDKLSKHLLSECSRVRLCRVLNVHRCRRSAICQEPSQRPNRHDWSTHLTQGFEKHEAERLSTKGHKVTPNFSPPKT